MRPRPLPGSELGLAIRPGQGESPTRFILQKQMACRQESRIGADGSEGRAVWPGAIGHQTSIGSDDVAGTQCRIISNGSGDKAEGLPAVAGTARDDPLP